MSDLPRRATRATRLVRRRARSTPLGSALSAVPLLLLLSAAARGQGGTEGGETGANPDPPAPPAVSEGQQVRRVFNLLVAAANRLDAPGEAAFFWRSPDLISVAQGTPTLGWEARDANARSWYARLESQSIRPEEVEVRAVAPGVVSLMATMRQEIRGKDGREWTGRGVWSLVFRMMEGEWKVVYEHYAYED
jgi:ketosteroid isomerase-like protein